jgi:RNA recognition motif-containing protein
VLKKSLSAIFSQYGKIVDIVAKKSLKAKGQAFVVFDGVEAAENAIKEVQAFPLFNKPMVLAFARTRSDATVKREAGVESREFEAHKRRRLAEKGWLALLFVCPRADGEGRVERKQAQQALESQRRPVAAPADKTPKKPAGLKSTAPAGAPQIPDEYLPPNTTLFLRDLPEDTDADTLSGLFGRFDGFKEVRMVPGRRGIAFVEFETLEGAISAKEGMGGMVLGDNIVKVTYQRQ